MRIMLTMLAFVLSAQAYADPIGDGVGMFAPRTVSWLPSASKPCFDVCNAVIGPNGAEREGFWNIGMAWSNQRSFVCKGKATSPAPWAGQGELYGNNFNSPARNTVCLVSNPDGGSQRLTNFACLCVK